MKPKFAILSLLIVLIALPLSGQLNLLHDTLIISTRENKYSGKQVVVFKNRITTYDTLTRPKGINGDVPAIFSFSLDSLELLTQIVGEGYVQYYVYAYDMLEDKPSNTRNCE